MITMAICIKIFHLDIFYAGLISLILGILFGLLFFSIKKKVRN